MIRVDPRDVLTRTTDLPDAVVRYAGHADALIDLHLPPAPAGIHPLVVLIHGGFWGVEYDRTHARPLANALATEGLVVATPEYRRLGATGERLGGWPTTFDDISMALGSLPELLDRLGVAVSSLTVVGHSAGGQLALWLANEPHPVDRVVALAPVCDLRAAAHDHLGEDATRSLLGGTPDEVPDRYAAVDPMTRLTDPPACGVVVLHGTDDQQVPVEYSRGLAARHPQIVFHELEGIEHFGLIDPLSRAWPVVRDAVSGHDRPT